MKLFKNISAFILSLSMALVCFAGCTREDETQDPTGPTDAPKTDLTVTDEYRIIVRFGASTAERGFAEALKAVIAERGINVEVKSASEVSDNYEKEILIGNTGREETEKKVAEGSDFIVYAVGQKLVIKGSSLLGLDYAGLYLKERIESEGLKFDLDFVYNGSIPAGEKLVLAGDQSGGALKLYDISNGTIGAPVWEKLTKKMAISGFKVRDTLKYGKVVVWCSEAVAEIVSYDTQKTLMSVTTGSNAHSVEITPDGKILAVAASFGSDVRFYNTDDGGYSSVVLNDAHGVLYDDEDDLFYMIGSSKLLVYKAEIKSDGSIELTEVNSVTIPASNAHDIMPVDGGKELYVSATEGVYKYNKATGKFSKAISVKDVKGIGSFEDGSYCYISPDKTFKDWTSASFTMIYKLNFSGKEYKVTFKFGAGTHVYKIRPLVLDYVY